MYGNEADEKKEIKISIKNHRKKRNPTILCAYEVKKIASYANKAFSQTTRKKYNIEPISIEIKQQIFQSEDDYFQNLSSDFQMITTE